MATVTYTLHRNQELTDEQKRMVREASARQDRLLAEGRDDEVYDDDCAPVTPESDPEEYQAMIDAVISRNQRIEQLARKQA
ncbi:MAG TPA: hypothetical protein DEV97_04365 [Lachnospiraceae bacterium]|jgi:hypothetical protein|nr:hypothetical protein [Lachnospiraceae bacterium]